MGCDIHLYKEKRISGQWVSADIWTDPYGDGADVEFDSRYHERNYNLFSVLSKGVRGEYPFSFVARGMPFNASHEVLSAHGGWGRDAHSASYLYLHELIDIQYGLDRLSIRISGMKDAEGYSLLQQTIASGNPNWDLLYPYCGWSSEDSYVEFEVAVPAAYILGRSLAEIIAGFDGVDGDNQRIVFWFDN